MYTHQMMDPSDKRRVPFRAIAGLISGIMTFNYML